MIFLIKKYNYDRIYRFDTRIKLQIRCVMQSHVKITRTNRTKILLPFLRSNFA